MAENSKIEWTDATWNPIRARNIETKGVGHYCEKVSPGCANCYAERMQPRFKNPIRYNAADRKLVEIFLENEMLTRPLRWRRPRMIFPGSMTDIFGSWVPDDWMDKIFAVMALTPEHTYQCLTKRVERMPEYLTNATTPPAGTLRREFYRQWHIWSASVSLSTPKQLSWMWNDSIKGIHGTWPLPNVWLGCSVENQKYADERREAMRSISEMGWTTFVSYEPALGPVDWTGWEFINQIISGGESGTGARPSHPDWHRATRDFCQANGIAYFFKQWGAWWPVNALADDLDEHGADILDHHGRSAKSEQHDWDDYSYSVKVGKRRAGRLLDGRIWNEFPEIANAEIDR
jgi:protein gp37